MKNKKTKTHRSPKRLSHTLYCYVEPINGKFARQRGDQLGSFSAYVDSLIAQDRKRTKKAARSLEQKAA